MLHSALHYLWRQEGDVTWREVHACVHVCIPASAGLAHCHLLPPRSEHSGSPDSPRTLSSSCSAPSAPWEPLTLCPDREDRAPPPGRKHHEEDGSQGFAACPSEYGLIAVANTSVTWRNKQGVVRPPLREACPSCLSVCNLHHSLSPPVLRLITALSTPGSILCQCICSVSGVFVSQPCS